MASAAYDNLCFEIYEEIYRRLERRDEDQLRFAAKGTAKKVLRRENLLRFFRSLVVPHLTALQQFGHDEDELVERVNKRNLHDFLAILIFGTCRIEAARTFTRELVARDDWPVRRRGKTLGLLPADRDDLIDLFGNVVAADKFFGNQACFSTVVIRKREEVRVRDPQGQRLPYLEEQALAKGSFGKVFKVKIARGHFYDPQTGMGNLAPLDMARKDYLVSSEFPARGEREIMEKILTSSARTCQNILENYGSLEAGPTTYSLFMPLAICDLRTYMMEHHQARPNTIAEKANMILSAEGLAGGLNFLHTEMETSDREKLVCYHMDLKPSNILIFREPGDDPTRDHAIWKLSDFGMARVKLRRAGQDTEREKDFNSWFVRRQKPPDPSLSATLNRRGEGTYLAPESVSSTKSMKAESDVWSLACVISVVFAYLEEGSDGIERYQDARLAHPNANGFDRFFLRGTRFTSTKVHPAVHKWHTRLINRADERESAEAEVVKFMLRYLEEAVFDVEPFPKRHGAKNVRDMLLKTFKKYKSLGEIQRDKESEPGRLKPPGSTTLFGKLRPRSGSPARGQVQGWYLSSTEAFKACKISPEGSLVAYWTDVKISLYTSQSLYSSKGDEAVPAAEHLLVATDCILKGVCLTQKYLVTSTTGANFNCYIFDLQRGTSVDASLDHWYRLTLPLPEIHRLSISPDGKTVACILRDKEGEQNPCSLFTASVADLIKYSKRPPSSSVDEASMSADASNTSIAVPIEPWELEKLDWPAPAVTHISFSGKDDIYLVVRAELTAKIRVHRIPIVHLSLANRTMESVIIESRGLDNSSSASLLTTFAPFHNDPATCAVITRENCLHIQNLTESEPIPPIHKGLKNYRVLKLIMDWHDDKMFALGTTPLNQRLLLLELTVPRSEAEKVDIRELAQLPGLSHNDEFTVRLSDEAGEKYILVAALVGANRRAIYRARLSEPEVE
ncbi:hypothetical protein B0H63DRAFT_435372 [Podospora didyma]|uniref:Protein kinase domain-containing protein n=1 Tax=Podospora didyma TaxID=330526 RepID=A0AAE0NHW6_9PEZI|nr:hypothetical protein B0H63DRAFT_435372 [Podospora didyma]